MSLRPLFRSFWMAGFEGADHVNGMGVPLRMNHASGHAAHTGADHARLASLGIRTVRESVGWRQFEAGGPAAEAALRHTAAQARAHGIQVIWTLMHYGWPRDLSLEHPDFVRRMAAFAERVARCVHEPDDEPPWFQPVNEISFLSWAASATALIHPYTPSTPAFGDAVKRQLVRASLACCDAIWRVAPQARIVHTDPLVHVIAAPGDASGPLHGPDEASQFEAWDMLCGTLHPELGGHPRYLDVLGVNYYHGNQWEQASGQRLHWHTGDRRRRPLSDMLADLWARYRRPLFIAETGHVGDGRVAWLDDIAAQLLLCRDQGTPVGGACLYPAIDRPDWENASHWHQSGLWDVAPDGSRRLCVPLAQRLRHWQVHWQSLTDHDRTPPLSQRPLDTAPLTSTAGLAMTHLIVFSHLRWDFVYQRPQHLLSRIAAHFPVLFIEEPMLGAAAPHLERLHPCAGVEVLRPHLPGDSAGFHDSHLAALQPLLAAHLASAGIRDYWLWFYTPMALPLAADLTPRGVVYDCMDELGAFRNAPRQLLQREGALLKRADLVFTGGPSLHESKKSRHANVHCLPSSVDAAHFAPAYGAPDHPAQAAIARPRLGYCGVIDERLDLDMVAALADARPEWSVVMVGPVVKIDPATLPQRPNIHWLGQQPYAALPQLVGGWDVCLMPFALNEATRFISPTKTLEYMAAGKPIVSTRITDVAVPYGHVVAIVDSNAGFVDACAQALTLDTAERDALHGATQQILERTSWDRSAQTIVDLLRHADARVDDAADEAQAWSPPSAGPAAPGTGGPDTPASAPYWPTVVLGAGPTGLSAAMHLGKDCLLLEAQATVGGWCRSIEEAGFTFDHAGHIMFSNDPFVLELYQRLLGDNVHWQNREAWIYSHGVYTRYPFQGALYGLPPEVLKECLVGAIEARFGAIDAAPGAAAPAAEPPRNFEEFIYKVWGRGVARHFAIPYNRKLWAVPLDEMETSWLGGRVPMPNLEEMIDGALSPVPRPMGPNARFGYPLKGGFQALMDGFLPLLEGPLELQAHVVSVSPARRSVTLADGRSFGFGTLVSTLQLPHLVAAIGEEAPEAVREAAQALRQVSVRCVNIGVGRENLTDKHWIYYPGDTVFHRIFVQGNASPGCNPPGGFGLTCEITHAPGKPLPCDGQALIDRCIAECIEVGIIDASDTILTATQVDMPCAYVVYDHARAANVQLIREWLAQSDIVLAGRYSEWEYYNSDHAFLAGRTAAQTAVRLNGLARAAGSAGAAR